MARGFRLGAAMITRREYLSATLIPTLVFLFFVAQFDAMGQKSSCPLTDSQSQKAVDAWAKIAAFLTSEPRCVNCHGKVNPYIDGAGLDPGDPFKDAEAPVAQIEHGGGKQKRPENPAIIDQGCKKCHNDMAKPNTFVEVGDKPPTWPEDGPFPNWTLAPTFLSFVDKDATTLCRQIKRQTGTADRFLGHLKDDNGQPNFAGTAFLGNRGLGEDDLEGFDVKPEPPSISHAQVMKLGQDWLSAMGGKYQGDDSCGCELTHALWSGTIHYVDQRSGDEGNYPDQQWSSRSLVTVTVTAANGVAIWHGHIDNKSFGKNWQPVANAPHRPDTSDEGEDSGDGTLPATVQVFIDEVHGTYNIQAGALIGPDGRSAWAKDGKPTKIGESHWTQCIRTTGCTSGTRDLGMPSLPPLNPMSGKFKDPNHIQASFYDRKENVGRSRKGVWIQSMTIDLWRSGSK